LGRAAAVLAVLGATLGVALDWMHVVSGTTAYARPLAIGVAWWTFPLFAGAGVAIGLGPRLVERALGRRDEVPSERSAAIGMACFVGAYLASCVVRGMAGAIALAAIAGLAWWLVDRRGIGVVHAVLAAIGGTAVEIALVRGGFFSHAGTEIAGVAMWLPCLYLTASIGIGPLARRLVGATEHPQGGLVEEPAG
jgi:hypothetical protein